MELRTVYLKLKDGNRPSLVIGIYNAIKELNAFRDFLKKNEIDNPDINNYLNNIQKKLLNEY